jgi:hypothetical protein
MHWQALVGDRPAELDAANEVRRHGDFFVKFSDLDAAFCDVPPDLQLIVEHLAYRVYACYGMRVPESWLVHDGRRLGLGTRKVPGVSVGSLLRSRAQDLEQLKLLPQARDVFGGFFVDVLLANWDVVGLHGDNLLLAADGIHRIDPGGALTFRARGDRKGAAFGDHPGELTTIRNPAVGTAGRVFAGMTANDEAHAAAVFRAVPWPELLGVLETTREQTHAVLGELGEAARPDLASAVDAEFEEIIPRLRLRQAAILRAIG